jgi:hypothetical protein
MDASGLSNPEHEPFVVVAGVMIDADKQWKKITNYLSEMVDEFAPDEHRSEFAFHATELFSGTKNFHRDHFNKELRWQILDEILSLPARYNLPVFWASITREDAAKQITKVAPIVAAQAIAVMGTALAADRWLEVNAENELAQMIMENDSQSRTTIHTVHRLFTDPDHFFDTFPKYEHPLSVKRIIYPIHFEDKYESSALQIADACAFAIKRHLMKKPEADRFYSPLKRQIIHLDEIAAEDLQYSKWLKDKEERKQKRLAKKGAKISRAKA